MEHKVPSKRNQSENRKNCKIIPFLWFRHFIMLLLSFLCAFVFSACEEKEDAIPPYVEMDQHTLDVMNYARNFRRKWDAAEAAVGERLALLRRKYGPDDPRYKDFDPARAKMEYMYNPIRDRRERLTKKYEKARGILEKDLARAEAAGFTHDAASLRGQLAELDKQHALNMADSDREDAEFRAMVGGTSGANGRSSSTKHSVATTIDKQIERNYQDLARINADLAYANSGFLNRWVNPLNWGRSIATMDTSQLSQQRQYLINQNMELHRCADEIRKLRKEVRKRGWTPEMLDKVMHGPSIGQELEEKAKAVAAEKEKKKAELAKTRAAMNDFGRSMLGFAAPKSPADPKSPVKPKSPINSKSLAAVKARANAPAAKAAPAKPAPVKKPVVAPKLKKKD